MVTKAQYTEYRGRPRNIKWAEVTVASGGTESSALDAEFYAIYGLLVPAIDSSTITFKVSDVSGGAYRVVKDKDGVAVSLVGGTGDLAVSSEELGCIAGYRYIKVVLSGEQSAERTLTWILKS